MGCSSVPREESKAGEAPVGRGESRLTSFGDLSGVEVVVGGDGGTPGLNNGMVIGVRLG